MDKNGKIIDVIVEERIGRDNETGLPKFSGLSVWADKGMKNIIDNIPGVHFVMEFGAHYLVDLDPRYDRTFLMKEIEGQLKINIKEGE